MKWLKVGRCKLCQAMVFLCSLLKRSIMFNISKVWFLSDSLNGLLVLGLLLAAPHISFSKNLESLASRLNDRADMILVQSTLPDGYEASLLAQLDSTEASTIWRSYILQKLDVLYLHPDVELEIKPVILARLWKESRNAKPTFAGTSLMTLLRLYEQKPEAVPADKLIERCEWVITRLSYSNSDRLSTLHVLAAIDQPKAAETAREWLTESDTAPMLQQTALNVLGKAPTPADRQLIETFTNHPDLRLRTAAKTALE